MPGMNAGQKADAAAMLERVERRRYASSGVARIGTLLATRRYLLGLVVQGWAREELIEMGADLIESLRYHGHDVGKAYVAMLDVADERRRDA